MVPVINLEKTGTNIKRLREEKELKISQIKDYFGFTNPGSIYKWEYGRSLPTLDNLVILAWILDVKLDDILVIEEAE